MKTSIALLALLFCSSLRLLAAPPVSEGKTIFTSRCAGCHNVNKVLAGPALAGVDQRRSIDWIVNFVQSSQTVIRSGDKDAVALFEQYNRIPMPDHKDLSADNIKSIVAFIQSEAGAAGTEKAPIARLGKLRPAYIPFDGSDTAFFICFLSAVALLIGGLLFAVRVKEAERNLHNS